jgi:hypothetical protein
MLVRRGAASGAITNRAHQANPMLGFTLYEQIGCNVPGIG